MFFREIPMNTHNICFYGDSNEYPQQMFYGDSNEYLQYMNTHNIMFLWRF